MAIDGSNIEVPDEADNVKVFGYPGSRTGVTGYPQAQCAVLVECATHAIIAANMGAYRDAEWTVCHPLLASLNQTMLCLADRGFKWVRALVSCQSHRAQLLWRYASNRQLPVQRMLADGSFLSVLQPSRGPRRKDTQAAVTVRVIEYTLPDAEGTQGRYRLLTTLLDEHHAPALELAAQYHERWEGESVFDELKTHLHQRRRVLRSKTPDLVRQEFYGWVLTHYAVRWLMHTAAPNITCRHARDPSWPTYSCCAEPSHSQRLSLPAHPRLRKRWFKDVLAHAAALWCVSNRGKSNPRMVKRRNTPYARHNRTVPRNQHQVFRPALVPPLPLSKRKWYSQAKNQLH